DGDGAAAADCGRAEPGARRGGERKRAGKREEEQLNAQRAEGLRQEREESDRERNDVSEEDRPGHAPELRVPGLDEGPDVDRERDEEKSEERGRGRDQGDVEVVPREERLLHQRTPRIRRATVRSDDRARSSARRATRSSVRIARSV